MKRFLFLTLIMILIFSVAGCARTKRIVNDAEWIVLDAEPSKDN